MLRRGRPDEHPVVDRAGPTKSRPLEVSLEGGGVDVSVALRDQVIRQGVDVMLDERLVLERGHIVDAHLN
eukprot:5674416-Heterocapsa_arctica.AAC.1